MGFLENLMGSGQQQDDYRDYVRRYDQGAPYDGISNDEVMSRYQQVAPHMSPQMYQESAHEAFSGMDPQERMQFGQFLQQQARSQGMQFQDLDMDGQDDRFQDPGYLSQITGRMEQQQPGMLGQLLGGALGGGLGGGVGNSMGGGMGGALSNPIAKAALGGIAAMAARRMMSNM